MVYDYIIPEGEFIRTMSFGGKTVKEGIYSPITQNKRHMELIKKICLKQKKNVLTKTIFAKIFDDFYQSIVVLANPKTILKDSYAPKTIRSQVIRVDQLIDYIKKNDSTKDKAASSDKDMEAAARFF